MGKHPVTWFYILAFGLSWMGWIPVALGSHGLPPFSSPFFQFLLILSAVGPALAAVVVTRAVQGTSGVQDLLKRLLQWRVGLGCYLAALLGPVVLLTASGVVTKALGLSASSAAAHANVMPVVASALVMSLLSNPWEEVGWRGFALPHLQKTRSALSATLIVGVLWGAWHLPLFFWVGNPMSQYPFVPWFVGTVAQAFLYTWLYNSTRGSLLLATLFHVGMNTFGAAIPGVSVWGLAAVSCLSALVLLVVVGGRNLSRQERVRAA